MLRARRKIYIAPMSQVASRRSVYSSVTQMLAFFRDDEALRQSPLVSLHFRDGADIVSTAKQVRLLILSAIDRMVEVAAPSVRAIAQRRRQILLRHDLGGESRCNICDDLGITERQFFRDRKAASELLALELRAALPKEVEPPFETAIVNDPAELALQAALRMAVAGTTSSALERSEAVARVAGDIGWRVVAKCLFSQLSVERGDLSAATELLDSAQALYSDNEAEIGQARAIGLQAIFKVGHGLVSWFSGAQKEATSLVRSGFDRFYVSPFLAGPVSEILMRGVVQCAGILSDAGELEVRAAALVDVRRVMERLPLAPQYLDLELRLELAKGQILLGSDDAAVAIEFVETMQRAQQLGLPAIAAEAARELGSIASRLGDVAQARYFQSAALGFADLHDSRLARAVTYAYASLMETRLGNPQRALELAYNASDSRPTGSMNSAYFDYVLARAQFARGLAEEALHSAEIAAGSSAIGEFGRAAALLLMAESAAALGRGAAASAHVDEAVARLGIYGQTYLMSQAHSTRKRLNLRSSINTRASVA